MTDFAGRMGALRERFVASAAGEADTLAEAGASGRWSEVRAIAHGLAGRAGMFGFPEVGAAALALEEGIEAGADPRGPLSALIAMLRALT